MIPEEWQEPEEWQDPDESELVREHEGRRKRVLRVIRLVALITLLAFSATALGLWPGNFNLPALDFLIRSVQLSRNPEYQRLQKAIFMVKTPNSQGTGFNVLSNGLVITNLHVVSNSREILVVTPDRVTYRGHLLARDREWDLALIKIEGKNLPVVPLGDSESKPGNKVIIIGDPLGFPQVIVEGRVKGLTRLEGWADPVLRLEGKIHPGNSGSPVFNTQGQVVGVVFATVGPGDQDGSVRDGLAIPVRYLHKLLASNNRP